MNWQFIFKTVFFGVIFCVVWTIAGIIFAAIFFSELFNVNIEEYVTVSVLLAGLPFSIYVYRNASSKKVLHAFLTYILIYILMIVLITIIVLALYLIIIIWCKIEPCRIIPFL